MFDGTNLRSSTSFSAGSANTRTNWFDTLTARQGFLVQPNVLIYAQGGAAWTNTSVTVFKLHWHANRPELELAAVANGCSRRTGRVFAEYNFMGFGGSNIQDLTAGVNYRF